MSDNIVNLSDKLRSKAATAELRRVLDQTIRQLRDYATRAEIARMLREAAEEIEDDGQKPA
jgi:hypothetical protein